MSTIKCIHSVDNDIFSKVKKIQFVTNTTRNLVEYSLN